MLPEPLPRFGILISKEVVDPMASPVPNSGRRIARNSEYMIERKIEMPIIRRFLFSMMPSVFFTT
ncbi:MAG: hypothetical protein N838_01650 [Thiohalocapsa sp. PB-PSB1]|nr:MAG: hypothetical protein N838_01650 [Thiohalocapsa sp. PB-PSB1]